MGTVAVVRIFSRNECTRQQRENLKASSAWLDTIFPDHHADADEPDDGAEEIGFSPSHAMVAVYSEATGCHDFNCLVTSITCETCKFGGLKLKTKRGENSDLADTDLLQIKFAGYDWHPIAAAKPVFKTRHDAQYEQCSFASTCRGSRARSELHELRRMGC